MGYDRSGVPVPVHVDPAEHIGDVPPNLVETSMRLVVPADDVAVGAIAERCICRLLALTHFVIPALVDVETDGAAAGCSFVAGGVTEGAGDCNATTAPVVHLSCLQICVVGEVACLVTPVPCSSGMLGGRYFPYLYGKL